MEKQLLELIEDNAKLSNEDLAKILNVEEEEIEKALDDLNKKNIIIGHKTLIDWDKTDVDKVTAIIEVNITPQRGEGFDKIAERIYRFNEVTACYLMSGGFDIAVIIEGSTMKEVALFVAMKLSPLEAVKSTATHFILKKYKDSGQIFEKAKKDERIKMRL